MTDTQSKGNPTLIQTVTQQRPASDTSTCVASPSLTETMDTTQQQTVVHAHISRNQ